MEKNPAWLEWARQLNAIAQAGLTYAENGYDRERYTRIRDISIDIMQRYTGVDHEKIRSLFANETGYPTPRVEVRAAVFEDERILLVREKLDGLWSLPGGWADVDTSLREAVIKEAGEEAGAEIEPVRIVAVQDRRKHNAPPMPYGVYKVFVECDFISGSFKENVETSEAGFFTLDRLPSLSEGRNTRAQIEMCFAARKKKVHEPYFD